MANLIYSLGGPYNDLTTQASVTLRSGTVDSDYPVTRMWDRTAVTLTQFTSTTLLLEFDLGSAQQVSVAFLANHNIEYTTSMYILANTVANTWGSPTEQVAFPRMATPTGAPFDAYYPNPWVDLTAVPARRYWALWIFTNGSNLKIGEFMLCQAKNVLTKNFLWGFRDSLVVPGRTVRSTSAGVEWKKRGLGYRRRLSAQFHSNDTGVAELLAWNRTCRGTEKGCFIVPDPSISDCRFVHFEQDFDREATFTNHSKLSVSWLEEGRGNEVMTG